MRVNYEASLNMEQDVLVNIMWMKHFNGGWCFRNNVAGGCFIVP